MSTNDKQTEPERTAMQEAIDIVSAVRDQYDPKYSDQESRYWELYSIANSLEELRDTVEKEQRRNDFAEGFKHATEDAPPYLTTAEWINLKYPNHGK